jgi:hypothetical protein
MEKEPTIKDVLTELSLFREYFTHELHSMRLDFRSELQSEIKGCVQMLRNEIQESAATLYSNIKYEMDTRFLEVNEKIDNVRIDLNGVKDELRTFKLETRHNFADVMDMFKTLSTKVYEDHEPRLIALERV